LAAIPAATVGVTALAGLLSSVGDVIGLFRSDYELKGQTLTTPEDIYIQAMVADRLRKANREVYHIDFQAIKESNLINDLNKLIKQELTLLSSAEAIKSTRIDVQAGLATVHEVHVEKLREKLVDYLVEVDEQVITTLRGEIDQKKRDI
jgi:hypothetical protein